MTTVLIAETDPRVLDLLPRIVSSSIPNVDVDICTSPDDLRCNRKIGTYDTVVISPILLQGYRLLKFKADRHLLAPIILTANRQDRVLASQYLKHEAFDLIAKPIVPAQAALSFRLALWQSRLLKLLASKEDTLLRFNEHMSAFPEDLRVEESYRKHLEILDATLHTVDMSLRMLLNHKEERSFLEMAAFVDQYTRERALDRLFTLCQEITSH